MSLIDFFSEYLKRNPAEAANILSWLCSEHRYEIGGRCDECKYFNKDTQECDESKIEEDC